MITDNLLYFIYCYNHIDLQGGRADKKKATNLQEGIISQQIVDVHQPINTW